MKSSFLKLAALGLASLMAVSSANAFWQCRVHNARGQAWIGAAPSRDAAIDHAMNFCVRNSMNARNCVIDWCQKNAHYVPAEPRGWQCEVTNARGQVWVGTGMSREAALDRAEGFCATHSRHARNCMIRSCFTR